MLLCLCTIPRDWAPIASATFAARTTSLVPTAQASADAQVRGHEQLQQQHGRRPHAPSDVFTCSSVRHLHIIIVVTNNNYCCALHSALRADEATLDFLDLYRMDVLFTAKMCAYHQISEQCALHSALNQAHEGSKFCRVDYSRMTVLLEGCGARAG